MTDEELEAEVTRECDILELQNLQAKYGYFSQRTEGSDWDELVDMFTDDAELQISDSGVYVGREGVEKLFGSKGIHGGGHWPPMMSPIPQLQPYIQVYGDTARMAAFGFGFLARLTGYPLSQSGERYANFVLTRYDNECRKVNGEWKYSKFFVKLMFRTPYTDGWCKTPVIRSMRRTFITPDRPPIEYQPYNPHATCKEEQMVNPILAPEA